MRPSLQRLFLGRNMKKAQTNEVYDGLWFHEDYGENLCSPRPNFGKLRCFGQEEKFGQSQFLKKIPCFFYYHEERNIFSILT